MTTISVVLSGTLEASTLPPMIATIPVDVLEVILVDGDATGAVAAAASAALPSIRIVERCDPRDGSPAQTAVSMARGDMVVLLDSDNASSWAW